MWITYTLIAIGIIGVSDLFRKLASGLKDPLFTNVIFQIASCTTAVILFLLFSRRTENNTTGILFAILGGISISLFSIFSFKALSLGPGASTVIPILRVGGMSFLVVLGIFILKEKLTIHTVAGLIISCLGIWLMFSNK